MAGTPDASGDCPEPTCSICVANYNGAEFIVPCIQSILDQDFDRRVEIIVHDDASTDGSADLVATSFPGVRLIRSETNVGFCVSNNRMVHAARGQYILLLNNDARLRPTALTTLYRAATQLGPRHILSLPQYDAESGKLLDIGILYDIFLWPIPNRDETRIDVGMVMGACLWLPREFWDHLGGFPEWFESIGEDMLLCLAARLVGGVVRALPDSGYDHHVGKSFGGGKVIEGGLRTTFRRRALSERNKTYVMCLCYPPSCMYPLLFIHLLSLTVEGLVLSACLRDARVWTRIYGATLAAVWRERGRLRAERVRLQGLRRCSLREFFAGHKLTVHKLTMLLRHGLPRLQE